MLERAEDDIVRAAAGEQEGKAGSGERGTAHGRFLV